MMRYSMLLVGLAATAAVACGGSDDNGGGGTAGKGGSSAAGSSSTAGKNGGGTGGTGTSGSGTGGSGTGSGTPGKVDSGAPDDKPVGDLTDDQFDALCESYGEAAAAVLGDDAKKATCGLAGWLAAQLSGATGAQADAACKMAYDDCLAEPDDNETNECTKPSSACTATVGEIEKCFTDQIAQAKELIDEFPSCDDLAAEYTPPAETDPPASCAVIEEKCPEALE